MAYKRRVNKDGSIHAHSLNIQDCPRLDLSPSARALYKYIEWAKLRPSGLYYDALLPAAKMAVNAVADVLEIMESALVAERKD
jgi:hypothetical protein